MNRLETLRNSLLAIVPMGAVAIASAAVTASNPSTVTPGSTFTYATFGSGDVIFQMSSSGLSQCSGFWLRGTDPGFKSLYAGLLMATTTQATITVYADPAQIWTGSGSPYCLVYSIAQ